MQLASMIRVLQQWEGRIRENQRGAHNLSLLQEQVGAVDVLRRRVAEQREVVRSAEMAVEGTRGQLTEAARWRKSLERLRERMRQEHKSACAAQQIKVSDDLATVRAAARIAGKHDVALTGGSA